MLYPVPEHRGAPAAALVAPHPTGARFRLRPLPGLVSALLLAAVVLCGAAQAEKGRNEGVYRDGNGGQHNWAIRRGHALYWNDQPYLPAGLVFRSAYLKAPTPETLRQDEEELDRLRAAGVQDLWVEPQRGLLENTPEQTQGLLDALERRGFRYGLRVGDRHRSPLVGFSPTLAPIRVPVSRLQPGARERWTVPTPLGRRAVYALVESTPDERVQNWAIAAGEVVVEREQAEIEVQLKNTRLLGRSRGLLLVAPEIQVAPEDLGSFGDLWEGMESYRDRLKRHLQALKPGPGLRFILDPFSAGDGTLGQEDQVFPSSPAFRNAFRDWLQKNSGINTLNINWRTTDQRIPTLDEAARLIPMWPRNDPPDGDGWLFDPVEKVAYRCIPRRCSIWTDLDTFRTLTLKRWMNTITSTLRTEGLNVPMLFTWGAYHPIFTNSPSPAGYDGLGAHLYGQAPDLGRQSAAYALAQAEEADRNTWLVATRLAGPPDVNGDPKPFTDAAQLRAAWAEAQAAGFRAAYLDPAQTPSAASLVRELGTAVAAAAPDEPPRVCFFPMALATADRVTRLSNGVWWVPSGSGARLLSFGERMRGYEIRLPFGEEHPARSGTVLWTTGGRQEVTFYLDRPDTLALYDSAGQPVKYRKEKKQVRFTLSEEPLVVSGIDPALLFPLELALAELNEFDLLLRDAEARKLDSAGLRGIYEQARRNLSTGTAGLVYRTVTPHVARLREELTPYTWIEGERSASHNLTGVAFQAGASGGTYLRLDRGTPPPSGVYRARYVLDIRRDGSYEFWIAGRVPGRPGVSPLIWQVDDEPAVVLQSATAVGPDYAAGMAWYTLGRMTLRAGRHELTLVVPQKAEGAGGRFSAGFDAIVLSREDFTPKGIEKPYTRAAARR